jgi:brefeldin A-resistance guanine nucleotide exchange factor 1
MTVLRSVKLLCQRSTSDNSALTMRGRNSWFAPGRLVSRQLLSGLLLSINPGPLMSCHSSEFDSHMFRLVWRPVVSAISTAFRTLDDDYVVEKVITGFRDCATLASRFELPEVFDFIVMSLAYLTGLAEEVTFPRQSNFPIVEVEGQTITVSPLSVRFGKSLRSQLSTVVLFTILNGNVNHLRESWTPVSNTIRIRKPQLNEE